LFPILHVSLSYLLAKDNTKERTAQSLVWLCAKLELKRDTSQGWQSTSKQKKNPTPKSFFGKAHIFFLGQFQIHRYYLKNLNKDGDV